MAGDKQKKRAIYASESSTDPYLKQSPIWYLDALSTIAESQNRNETFRILYKNRTARISFDSGPLSSFHSAESWFLALQG